MSGENDDLNKPIDMDFDEALARFAQTDPKEMPMKGLVQHTHNGEAIHQRHSDGFINATAMCKSAGKAWSNYRQNTQTESFINALEGSLGIPRDVLIQSITTGTNDRRGTWVHPQLAINLATWLSPEFAVQVSEWVVNWMMGVAEKRTSYTDFESLTEDEKRLYLRDQVTGANKKLADAAKGAGVETPKDFGIFQHHGYKGMYGGRGVKQIREHKGLAKTAAVLDHMGSAELAANLFRITQTEEKLVNEQISNKLQANQSHFEVGKRVRLAMMEISGIYPEDLPTAPDVKKLQKEREKALKDVTNAETLPSPDRTEAAPTPNPIDLRKDLWKYALLVIVQQPDMQMSTSDLIAELPNYIAVPDEADEALQGRKDNKFSQLVRNLKSHKTSKTNFIYQGYAESIEGGFRGTDKGLQFVKEYFADRL